MYCAVVISCNIHVTGIIICLRVATVTIILLDMQDKCKIKAVYLDQTRGLYSQIPQHLCFQSHPEN